MLRHCLRLGAESAVYVKVVCDFCEKHLEANKQAFADPRLHLIIDDARAQLEKAEGPFDVIIGDLADPVFGGPCYQVFSHTLKGPQTLPQTLSLLSEVLLNSACGHARA